MQNLCKFSKLGCITLIETFPGCYEGTGCGAGGNSEKIFLFLWYEFHKRLVIF